MAALLKQTFYGTSGGEEPLFFFYDCEATTWDLREAVIIEVGATIHTGNLRHPPSLRRLEYESLCRSSKELHPEVEELTGLTRDMLRRERPVRDVLSEFFDWIERSVMEAGKRERRRFVPVLVAHSGFKLDFPALQKAVGKIGVRDSWLKEKFEALNLHYVDSMGAVRDLHNSGRRSFDKFGVKDIYKVLFEEEPGRSHRALDDARALCKIFTEADESEELMSQLRKYIQSRESGIIIKGQIRKFQDTGIPIPQAIKLLQRCIGYEYLKEKAGSLSEEEFIRHLKEQCGMENPERGWIEHFQGRQASPDK